MFPVSKKARISSWINPNVILILSAVLKIGKKFLAALQNYQRCCHYPQNIQYSRKSHSHRKTIV